jgi:ABC-type oligopeptide transport system substrate-binding subunit
MSSRLFAALVFVVASLLTACAESVTAPERPPLAPSSPRHDSFDPSVCRGGVILSEGRCD